MLLKDPVQITPSLLSGVKIGDAYVSIRYADRDGRNGRTRYRWEIVLPDGREFSGDDLQSGCQGGDLRGGLESLLCFLGAFAEAQRYPGSENVDLFPTELADWAQANADEFSMLESEITETPDCIQE